VALQPHETLMKGGGGVHKEGGRRGTLGLRSKEKTDPWRNPCSKLDHSPV